MCVRYFTRKEKSLLNTGKVTNLYKFRSREEGKRSLQTLKRKWVNNIKIYVLKKRGCGLDSSGLRNGRVARSSKHGNKKSVFVTEGDFLSKSVTISFSIKN